MLGKSLQAAVAGQSSSAYIEDVFSTYLYTGNGSTQTITNGIDLATEGGLVWIKRRDLAASHYLTDTGRGKSSVLTTNSTSAAVTTSDTIASFNSNGFSLTDPNISGNGNYSGYVYASWTLRKAPKFFDVVTYTGNGNPMTINHNLGSVPGCMIVKRTDSTGEWKVYHRSTGNGNELVLNSIGNIAATTSWNSTTPTSTSFYVDAPLVTNGATYVAYLFAHDAGGFGDAGDQNVISCGSFTTASSGGTASVTLGYEPQWILIKPSSTAGNWVLFDNMRGMPIGSSDSVLQPNLSNAESTGNYLNEITATGFTTENFTNSETYIYIAIRRGPMKTPTDGTSVFAIDNGNSTSPAFTAGFPLDFALFRDTGNDDFKAVSRLTGSNYLITASTSSEGFNSLYNFNEYQESWLDFPFNSGWYSWMFRRAPGFFDVVAYTGNNTAGRNINHNLTVAPELMIIKCRDLTEGWAVYHKDIGNNYALSLNSTANAQSSTLWYNTTPTSSVFTLTTDNQVNADGTPYGGTQHYYVAYLFASVAGVSKVGSYTGTGTTLQINCGFSAGARFVLIKRKDSTGDWYVWDSTRGIVSGNDPYLLLNSTAAEVTSTDYIDPLASGFEISSTAPAAINASGGTYIYLAIS